MGNSELKEFEDTASAESDENSENEIVELSGRGSRQEIKLRQRSRASAASLPGVQR